jgi:hypothetical protein
MDYSKGKYYNDPITGELAGIEIKDGGFKHSIPINEEDRHYAEILRQVDAGTITIEDAD